MILIYENEIKELKARLIKVEGERELYSNLFHSSIAPPVIKSSGESKPMEAVPHKKSGWDRDRRIIEEKLREKKVIKAGVSPDVDG